MPEKRLLQFVILVAGCVPVVAGFLGALKGADFMGGGLGPGGDSQFRYLSGLLLGIGLVFWWCIPSIERRTETVRALAVVVVAGGIARAFGWIDHGDPGASRWALIMELGVTPLICLWQTRVARLDERRAQS